MLLKNCCHIVEQLKVNLYFDDNTEKHLMLSEKDIVRIVYNNNGRRDTIVGKVTKIQGYKDYHTDNREYSYLVIDGSDVYRGQVAKIRFDYILDCEIIEKFDENLIVKTVTNQDEAINKIKLVDEKLYVSKDNGETWTGGIDIVPDPPTDTTKVVVVNGVMYKSEDGVNWTSEVTEEDASDTESPIVEEDL